MTDPLIIFVPGLRPKPEPHRHAAAMQRCLVRGIATVDEDLAGRLPQRAHWFELIDWNYAFYNTYHDIETDGAGIDAVLRQPGASERDRKQAYDLRRRLYLQLYRFADRFQFLIPRLADAKTRIHLRDLKRYVHNEDGIGEQTRQALIGPLLKACEQQRPVLLIGHSMGSLIAYDALWQLSHTAKSDLRLDTLVTLGSPLGQRYVQHRLLGSKATGAGKYPQNIRRWINIAAVGDLTALDVDLRNDYAEMLQLGLVESIDDMATYNYFRDGGAGGPLNVHSEYGYLVNTDVARVIAEWWARSGRS